MSEELLLWVDENDRIIGYGGKMETHVKEQLHRAFSLFIFNQYDNKLLIHKRARGKYHSGGLWTNSCCSHPRKDEELREAVIRRVKEELGLELREEELTLSKSGGLIEVDKFQYYQKFGNCAENEIDHVFYLLINKPEVLLKLDADEIEEVRWVSEQELIIWMEKKPENFTAWFEKAFEIVRNYIVTKN